MKISIILPIFNMQSFLARAINSCCEQGVDEIILVDDASSDESLQIIKQFASTYKNIKTIHHEHNKGTYEARRSGVMAASGDYVMFLDPDDELEPGAIEYLKSLLSKHPGMDFYSYELLNNQRRKSSQSMSIDEYKASFKYSRCGICDKLFSQKLLKQAYEILGECDKLVYAEDALVHYAAIKLSRQVYTSSKQLYRYYDNQASITRSLNASNIARIKSSLDRVFKGLAKLQSSMPEDDSFYQYYQNVLLVDFYSLQKKSIKKANLFSYLKIRFRLSKRRKIKKKFEKSYQ